MCTLFTQASNYFAITMTPFNVPCSLFWYKMQLLQNVTGASLDTVRYELMLSPKNGLPSSLSRRTISFSTCPCNHSSLIIHVKMRSRETRYSGMSGSSISLISRTFRTFSNTMECSALMLILDSKIGVSDEFWNIIIVKVNFSEISTTGVTIT